MDNGSNSLPPQPAATFSLKHKIFIMLALLAAFSLLVYFVRRGNARTNDTALRAANMQAAVAANIRDAAARSSEEMRERAEREALLPGISTVTVNSDTQGHMAVVGDKNFSYVPAPQKSMTQVLSELAADRRTEKLSMDDKDLSKQVASPSQAAPAQTGLKNIPPGAQSPLDGLPSAPVSYKLFTSAQTYADFKDTHRATKFPKADFDRQTVVMLVSNSDFPNRIFSIVSAEETGGVLHVRYRVNIFAASDAGEDTFAAMAVKKTTAKVELDQIP
jgi:hypothetical protein